MSAKNKQNSVCLDDIFANEIGQFGLYQVLVVLLASIFVIFSSWSTTEYVFTTARITTRCFVPQCEEPNSNFTTEWILNAIPSNDDSIENCKKYGNSLSYSSNDTVLCSKESFNHNITQNCDNGFVYENANTIVYDFDLACDEWWRSLIGTAKTLGYFLNMPLTGYVSDRWGRRVALIFNSLNTCWIGIVRSFVNSYGWFISLEILEAAVGAGTLTCAYILVAESVGPKYRAIANIPVMAAFSIGQITIALIASAIEPWRSLTRILYGPQLIVIILIWFVPESIRWLIKTQNFDHSKKLLIQMAKINRKQVQEESLKALEKNNKAKTNTKIEKETWLPILVFRCKPVLLRCLVTPIWWITVTMLYYGLSINSVGISLNRYLNFSIVSTLEVPGHLTGVLIGDRFGRKPVLICAFFLSFLCQVLLTVLPSGNSTQSLCLFLFGKYACGIAAFSIYTYTGELYPTKHRHSLFAFSSMVGRIGSMIAPLTPALALLVWSKFPSALFGCMSLLSCALTFLMPETLGTKLPDSMEEAKNLQKNKL